MSVTITAPQRSTKEIKDAMERDAEACAANHVSSSTLPLVGNIGPSYENELAKCRGQVAASYKNELDAAQGYDFGNQKVIDGVFNNALTNKFSLTKQQLIIAALVLLFIGAVIIVK